MSRSGLPKLTILNSSGPPKDPLGYSSWHAIYYRGAIESLATLEQRGEVLLRLERRVFAPTYQGGPLAAKYVKEIPGFIVLATTTQLLCSMATEALLNLYGVMRVGERLYQRSIERLGPSQKLELLLGIFDGYKVTANDELATLARQLFDVRNRLVHPKSKESDLSEHDVPGGPLRPEVRETVKRMKTFFELFARVSAETRNAVEYFGPLA